MASKSQSNKKKKPPTDDFYLPSDYGEKDDFLDGGITVFFRELGILKDDDNKSDKDTE